MGPRRTLTTFAGETLAAKDYLTVVPAQGQTMPQQSECEHLLWAIGKMWVAGARPDWAALHEGARRRVPLPTYPFERKRFWIEPATAAGPQPVSDAGSATSAASAASAAGAAAAASLASAPTVASAADLGALIHRQLAVMTEQLKALDVDALQATHARAGAQAIED